MLNAFLAGTPRNLLGELKPELLVSGLANRLLLLPGLSDASAQALAKLSAIEGEGEDEGAGWSENGGGEVAVAAKATGNLATRIAGGLSEVEAQLSGKPSARDATIERGGLDAVRPPPASVIELRLAGTPTIKSLQRKIKSFQDLSAGYARDPVYARFSELVYKVAAILQRARCLLAEPLNLVVDEGDLADALEFVTLSCLMMSRVTLATGGGIAKLAQDLWEWLRRQQGQAATQSDFRAKNRRAPYRAEAEAWLLERRLIRLEPNLRGGGNRLIATGSGLEFR